MSLILGPQVLVLVLGLQVLALVLEILDKNTGHTLTTPEV